MNDTRAAAPRRDLGLRYVLDPAVTPALVDGLAALWADVVNAGGAVGFLPTVTPEDVKADLRKHLIGMAEGTTRLLIGTTERGRPVATAFFSLNTHRLMRHWVWLKTVMVHPDLQGRGTGRELMAAASAAARSLDPRIAGIRLTCRGGLGLERFYAACGYREVGRVPGAIEIGGGELRDDVTMWLPLAPAPGAA
ncbi:GNAT family N-acetyltransferase [Streptomyces radicis]|uniref:N-acetyltransferase n=1 Tax=Streptomyces radicis TaxID=1750517 RepID=A0A3A9VYG0_9ACTN|nr:GNAT family N-acetyltransferase [Streptomyces radicis]RKN05562.1 N-acetyltransferase [Streptomyces radicis]RKN17431.1 N-acetyltransferase [Streptomyces radicis]